MIKAVNVGELLNLHALKHGFSLTTFQNVTVDDCLSHLGQNICDFDMYILQIMSNDFIIQIFLYLERRYSGC